MAHSKFVTLVVAGLAWCAASPAFAASPITEAFLSNVEQNVKFLASSSQLAQVTALSGALRTFARAEANEQIQVAAELPAHETPSVASITAADGLLTGRSVATDGQTVPVGLGQAANGRQPIGSADLDHLATLSGRAFDDLYWQTQLDALSQLRADYSAYIAAGDDAGLVALAKRELPKVERQLLALSKV